MPSNTTTSTTTHAPVYITLPVADLERSVTFFTALGFAFDARFASADTACLALNATTFVMLATHDKFAALPRVAPAIQRRLPRPCSPSPAPAAPPSTT